MHVQSSHHLISGLVIKERLVLHTVVDLEVARIGVQLHEEGTCSLTLMGQTVGDKELSVVASKDPLVLLL